MWWMAMAMVHCYRQLNRWRDEEGFDAFVANQVHDELVFDLPAAADPRTDPKRSNLGRIRTLRRLMMERGDDIGVPTPVSVSWHPKNWMEGIGIRV
jgi:hypothetical protein